MNYIPEQLRESLLFYMPFDNKTPNAKFAKGSSKGDFSTSFHIYSAYLKKGIRNQALALVDENMIRYKTKNNIDREKGSIALWLRPLFDWQLNAGRIIFDMSYNKGDVTGNPDPSQRMALVYSAGKGRKWRFFISTDRNCYMIGTKKRRTTPRSRFFVGSGSQAFKLGEWMHIVLTWEKDRAAIYINGKLEGWNLLNDGVMNNLPDYFSLGTKASWMNANALSYMDEFMIYDRAFSEKDVQLLYESYDKKVENYSFDTKSPNKTFEYKADIPLLIGQGNYKQFEIKDSLNSEQGTIHLKVKPNFNSQHQGQFIFLDARRNSSQDPDCLVQFLFNLGYRSFGAFLATKTENIKSLSLLKTGQRILSGANRFRKGKWLTLTLTWNREYAKFHINGVLEGIVKLNDGLPEKMPTILTLGSKFPPEKEAKEPSTALIKELIIYDTELDDSQIGAL